MAVRSAQWDKVIAQRIKDCEFLPEQRQWLSNSTVADAKAELEDVENKHKMSNKSLKALGHMKPLMDTFGLFADFASQLASLDPHGVASLVLGSLRITIKVRCISCVVSTYMPSPFPITGISI